VVQVVVDTCSVDFLMSGERLVKSLCKNGLKYYKLNASLKRFTVRKEACCFLTEKTQFHKGSRG